MWISYSNKGKKIIKDFWDWGLMNVCIQNYIEEGMDGKKAYEKFWEEVKKYDEERYELCLKGKTINEALGDEI